MAATFKNTFAAVGVDLRAAIDEGNKDAAELIADLASQLAPYDATSTGKHLNQSIEARKAENGWEVVAGVGLSDIRAIVQEYGSVHQEAQPYLTPASQQIDVERAIADAVRRRLQ